MWDTSSLRIVPKNTVKPWCLKALRLYHKTFDNFVSGGWCIIYKVGCDTSIRVKVWALFVWLCVGIKKIIEPALRDVIDGWHHLTLCIKYFLEDMRHFLLSCDCCYSIQSSIWGCNIKHKVHNGMMTDGLELEAWVSIMVVIILLEVCVYFKSGTSCRVVSWFLLSFF